ncbi:tRNA (guanine-N(7)-)-methyltransferase (tRNA(m7G46)-methyltransferase), partial [Coemansia sp. RSA 2424]
MDSSANIPSALRHFLARGASTQQQQQQQAQQAQGNGHCYNTYTPQSAASSMATLQPAPQAKLTPARSSGNLRTGSTIGAWLTKYHLRPGGGGGGSSSAAPAAVAVAVAPAAALAGSALAQAAYITSVESREPGSGAAAGAGAAEGEPRMGGLRMGRRRFLEYRIQVTGAAAAQWRVARRYSEFHALHQALRRQFPARAHGWAELFPSKRLLPGLGGSNDSVMQRRERLNAFLRALTHDADVCRSAAVQAFLRDDAAASVHAADHRVGQRPPLPDAWAAASSSSSSQKIERMASMPALKPAPALASPPPPMPSHLAHNGAALQRPAGGYHTTRLPPKPPQAPQPMPRKTSDPLAYAATTAEKRANAEPQSMRKKYGLRRNVLHRNDRVDDAPAPDTAATRVAQWDDAMDYVMVDGEHMDVDRTLRTAIARAAADDDDHSTPPATRSVVALRRAPLGGIEKTRRALPADDPAMAAARAMVRSGGGKRQLVAVPAACSAEQRPG